jgi:hypothetical protein
MALSTTSWHSRSQSETATIATGLYLTSVIDTDAS